MNMPLVLLNRRRRGNVFTPSGLFALAEPGVWYDPSDLTTLFQDTAGTTPVTTAGQTVALALDKSKGLVLGSETVVSPLAGALGTSYSVVGNTVVRNGSTGTAILNAVGGVASATNKTYLVTFTASGVTGDATGIRVGGGTAYGPFSGDGTFTLRVVGGGASGSITFIPWVGGAATATYSNISVKELPGFHATQATAASRPTYGIVPLGGRRNLLTRTEELGTSPWGIQSGTTVTANTHVAPNGTTTADTVATTTGSEITQTVTVVSGAAYRVSMSIAKTSGATTFPMIALNGSASFGQVFLNTNTGSAAVRSGVPGATSVTVTDQTTFWRVAFTFIPDTTTAQLKLYPAASTDGTTFAGSLSGSCVAWGAQLETGSTATAYQRVGSAFDVTEAGVASLSYLSFDGVDDFLQTPTITPGTDKAQVFAGVRKLSDAAVGTVAELSANSGSNSGSFGVFAPGSISAAIDDFGATLNGSAFTGGRFNGYDAPTTRVISSLFDISQATAATEITFRANGSTVLSDGIGSLAANAGTGNFLAYPLFIGRRGGTTVPFNGQLYSLVVRFGPNLDAGTITSTETWVNGKTGAYA